eukprot:symbB.v1.2.027999.t1/scaffold2918.1/size67253/3
MLPGSFLISITDECFVFLPEEGDVILSAYDTLVSKVTMTGRLVNVGAGSNRDPLWELADARNVSRAVFIDPGGPIPGQVIPRGVQFLTEAAEPGNLAFLLRKGKLLPKKSPGVMQIDFLKVDVDGCDCVLAALLLRLVRPKVIIMEINWSLPPPLRFVRQCHEGWWSTWIKFSSLGLTPSTHGCSLSGAVAELSHFGYSLWRLSGYVNALFVREDMVCAAAINSCVVPFDSGQDDVWLEALRLFQDLTATTEPDGVTYIALLSAFAGCSRWEEALLLHRQTEHSESLEDRLRCTNCVVTACARGIAWPIALQVFDETPRPSLVTNNAVLSAFAEGSQWRLALQVLQELPRQKLSPTEVTLNTVLYALCRGSHHVAAQRLLGNMPSYSLTADLYSYTTVMSACTSVSCWEMTCDLLCTMISKKIDPDIYSINNIIGALANTPKWKEALHMFSNMQNFRMAPDFVTHSVIIAGRLQAAAQEGQQMLPGSMELERRW